jgi:hypothetical protein
VQAIDESGMQGKVPRLKRVGEQHHLIRCARPASHLGLYIGSELRHYAHEFRIVFAGQQ